jgi:Family of unknown function (DUF5565)
MVKIISLFQRNYETDHLVRDEVVPGAEWVLAGEGVSTRKWDGTCAMIKDGKLYKRYDAKKGKMPPNGFIPAQEPDVVTGHWPGWVKITDKPEDKWFNEAENIPYKTDIGFDGTYELIGPKINGNAEKSDHHLLVKHGANILSDAPRTFNELKEWFANKDIEGIVWHHPDGRMVKIKKKDFGYKR